MKSTTWQCIVNCGTPIPLPCWGCSWTVPASQSTATEMTIPSFHAVPRVVRFVANITVPFYSQFHKLHHYSWTIFQTSGIYPLMTQKSLSNFHLRYSSPRLCHYVDKLHCSSRQMCQGPMVQQVQQGKTDCVWFQICPHPVHSHHPWDRKWKVVHCITRGKNDCSSLVTDDWNSNDTYPTANIYSVRSDCSRHVNVAKHHCKAGRQYVLNVLCESQIKQCMPSKETNKLEDQTFQAWERNELQNIWLTNHPHQTLS